jgi:hypothetical protein
MYATIGSAFLLDCSSPKPRLEVSQQLSVLYQVTFEKLLSQGARGDTEIRGYCLGVGSPQGVMDPTDDVMKTLREHRPPVWAMSQCGSGFGWHGSEVHDTAAVVLQPPSSNRLGGPWSRVGIREARPTRNDTDVNSIDSEINGYWIVAN